MRKLLAGIILSLLVCLAMLSGCNSNPIDPNQELIPSDPTMGDENNIPTEGDNNVPTDSTQTEEPDNTDSGDSSIMDGDDYIQIPFD